MLKKKLVLLMAVFVFILAGCAMQNTSSAKQLEQGKKYYEEGNYDAARDNFIDVMMHGTPQEYAEANMYVNKIHNQLGNVEPPKFIPDTDAEKAKAAQPVTDAKTQAEAEAQAIIDKANAEAEAIRTAAAGTTQVKEEVAAAKEEAAPTGVVVEEAKPYDPFEYYAKLDPNSYEAQAKREQVAANTLINLRQQAVNSLSARKGVKIYFRNNDIDAIDIESAAIFDKSGQYSDNGLKIIEDLYTLMVLSPTPSFVILPPGSYTDDVNLSGVKQAVALSSYLIYKGISPAKLSYNMGLYNEEPPAKFSNLDGLSIVFDFDALPVLQMPESGEKLPIMSLAMAPVSQQLNRGGEDGVFIDYSVIETKNPITRWTMQIVQHNADGKYYIIRQVEGSGPVYYQTFWNARKNFFGEPLPAGKYTAVLTAVDSKNQTKILKRRITVLPSAEELKKAKATAAKKAAASVSYKAKYLWTRPGRTDVNIDPSTIEEMPSAAENNFPSEEPYYEGDMSQYDSSVPTTGGASAVPQPGSVQPGTGYYPEDNYDYGDYGDYGQ